ncbi:DmsC/YnfH family molybdoenzyme membrane anchor subunit [Aeromonas media]|uniref:DmsC/YnfH family molybdoenzyme membrane anchor subunit n=1 Tax=Aeromonas media TaxID=651 RepID=UPI0038CF3FB7
MLAIAVVMLSMHLGSVETSVTSALATVPDLAGFQSLRLVLLATGVMIWLLPLLTKKSPALTPMVMAFGLILVSELIGRGVFYGMHLTAGM